MMEISTSVLRLLLRSGFSTCTQQERCRDDARLDGLMGEDGITNCGNAQNCVKACPMEYPVNQGYL